MLRRFAERVEQIFGVVAVVKPDARGGGDHLVDSLNQRFNRCGLIRHAMDLRLKLGGDGDGIGGEQRKLDKPGLKMVADRAFNLDRVFGKNQRNRAFRQGCLALCQKLIKRPVFHALPICPWPICGRIR